MAKKHVNRYFLEQQATYLECLADVKELDEEAKKGNIPENVLNNLKTYLDKIKSNYETIAYFMFLLNKPNRDSKAKKEEETNKAWYDYLKGHSKESMLDESYDALCDFKKIVKEVKNNHE